MAESSGAKPWAMRAAFVGMAFLILYWQFLPFSTAPRNWAGPDLILVLVTVWVLRRPDYTTVSLVGGVMLIADFLLARPPGLMAAITVLVTENLRKRAMTGAEMPLSVEWLIAAAGMSAIVIANRILTSVFLLDQTSLGLSLIQLLASIFVYPVVAGFLGIALGLRKTRFRESEIT